MAKATVLAWVYGELEVAEAEAFALLLQAIEAEAYYNAYRTALRVLLKAGDTEAAAEALRRTLLDVEEHLIYISEKLMEITPYHVLEPAKPKAQKAQVAREA